MTTPDPRQTEFEFGRGEQLDILRRVRLVTRRGKDGITVSPKCQRAVLRVIDDHARPGRPAWISYGTIATESDYGVRTVKRAIEVLCDQSLLVLGKRRIGKTLVNTYRVVWTELYLLTDQSAVPTDQSAVPTDQSAVPTDQSAVTTDQSAVTALKPSLTAQEPPPPTVPEPTTDAEEEEICESEKDGIETVVAELRRDGLATAADTAAALLARVGTIDAAVEAIREARAIVALPANRPRLRSIPGAIAWYLSHGVWPTPLVSPAAQRAAAKAMMIDRPPDPARLRVSPNGRVMATAEEIAAAKDMTVAAKRALGGQTQ